MPEINIRNRDDIRRLQEKVRKQAKRTRDELKNLNPEGMEALYAIKFCDLGYHPSEDRRLDFIEQINQTFTFMVSLAAAAKLIDWFPCCDGLRLNLGATSGRDIESISPNVVEAEVFSAKHPRNANKLKKDIDRLSTSSAANQYVFFFAPSHQAGQQPELEQRYPDTKAQIWALGREEIM